MRGFFSAHSAIVINDADSVDSFDFFIIFYPFVCPITKITIIEKSVNTAFVYVSATFSAFHRAVAGILTVASTSASAF